MVEADPGSGFTPGDRVYGGNKTGSFAEFASLDAGQVRRIPGSMGFPAAASFSAAYSTAYTALVELGDPANLEILVDLLSTDAVRVTPGADATIDGWGGAPLTARVRRIDPSAFTRVSALGIEEQRVTVLLDLLGDPTTWRGLGDGYRVTARISLWRGQGLVGVPMGAIFRSGPDWAVYLAMEGRAVLRKIVLGEWNQTYAEVRSGLNVADRVILHPGDTIADGVAIAEEPAPR